MKQKHLIWIPVLGIMFAAIHDLPRKFNYPYEFFGTAIYQGIITGSILGYLIYLLSL